MAEAVLESGVPVTAGWFIVNVRDARWLHNRMRSVCHFGGQGEAHFDELGVSLYWLQPGHPMSLYHHEARQEDFLVLRGDCRLVIEGEERLLRAWDFVHCPPRTAHAIVAADKDPALVLAVGARKEKGGAHLGPPTHGEPDAAKVARPVRRAAVRKPRAERPTRRLAADPTRRTIASTLEEPRNRAIGMATIQSSAGAVTGEALRRESSVLLA